MMKKLLSLLLVLSMVLSLLPLVAAEEASAEAPVSRDLCCSTRRVPESRALTRPDFTGMLHEITPQRVEDTFRYLEDFYEKAHPEMALQVHYGDREDKQVLLTLAQIITKDCKTDREKADAVANWVKRNIVYELNASAYATDAFYDRQGNCLSYAFLIQTLLRLLQIPAVLGDGWRGDMKTNTVELFNYDGHAWVFVYLEGEWVLYDPLWLAESTTDRDYMAEWIYFDTVEFITPAYDGENLPPEAYDKVKAYYTDGVHYVFSSAFPDGPGVLTSFINNISISYVTNQDEPINQISDGWIYLDSSKDETTMRAGQVYADSWLSYGDYRNGTEMCLTYAHANGMMIDGAVMEYDGVDYMMYSNQCLPIQVSEDIYSITYGLLTLPVGYEGPYLAFPWGEKAKEGCTITVENKTPEIAVANEQGIITCLSEGFATFHASLIRDEDNGYLGGLVIQLRVSDEERIPDYTDRSTQDPNQPDQPDLPDLPDQPDQPDQPDLPDLPDQPDPPAPEFTDTVEGSWYEESVSYMVSQGLMNGVGNGRFNPNGSVTRAMLVTILYRAEGEPSVEGMSNPFTDVPDAWYHDAVIWAAAQGIVNGVSKDRFNPNGNITREQIATILYRYEGIEGVEVDLEAYTDGNTVSGYARQPMTWATQQGLINGVGGGRLAPTNTATRAQIATILARYLQKV